MTSDVKKIGRKIFVTRILGAVIALIYNLIIDK